MSADTATQRALERLDASGFDSLTPREKTLATIWALEAEVNNGGFDQFFFNSAGDLAFYAPVALRTIGANQMAALAEEANSVFGPSGPPRDWETRRALVRQFSDEIQMRLDSLDTLFYKYQDDIRALMEVYVAGISK
jgi:hypothetical protein